MEDQRERFTDQAQQVLAFAEEEAHRLNHDYVGTEHLLLGLVRQQDAPASRILDSLGVGLPRARAAVERTFGQGGAAPAGDLRFSSRAETVLDLAADEADHRDHGVIRPEHLLLGLTDNPEGIAAGVLEGMGVDVERLRRDLLREMEDESGRRGTGETGSPG